MSGSVTITVGRKSVTAYAKGKLVVNEHGEVVDAGAVYARTSLATISQVVSLLKSTKAKEEGVALHEFARAGHIPPMAVVQELRRRGYEIETFDEDERCRLLAVPAVGTRKRKADQVQLFDPGPREKRQTTPYEDAG
jgi:predicted HTH domain antitoxin